MNKFKIGDAVKFSAFGIHPTGTVVGVMSDGYPTVKLDDKYASHGWQRPSLATKASDRFWNAFDTYKPELIKRAKAVKATKPTEAFGLTKLTIGQKVKGKDYAGREYTATVRSITGNTAELEREDEVSGCGGSLSTEKTAWTARKDKNGKWTNNSGGELLVDAGSPLTGIKAEMDTQNLRRGDRVVGKGGEAVNNFRGTVYSVSKDGNSATIRRNDGQSGRGDQVFGRFYNGARGWLVARNPSTGQFGSNVTMGSLTVVRNHHKARKLVTA